MTEQLYRVELAGQDITDLLGNVGISKVVNRFYNVASIEIGSEDIVSTILGKTITIYYGNNTFTGVCYSSSRVSQGMYKVVARTFGAYLTEPFSAEETVIEDAQTALELCALYAADIGVSITYQSEDLDFGGSYEREGTKLTALTTIANTIGAEYFDDGTGIVIQPNKPIDEGYDTEVTEGQFFDFVNVSESLFNGGISTVRTSTGTITTGDVIEENKINLEVYDTGEAHIYCIPKGTVSEAYGIQLNNETLLTKDIASNTTIIDETVIYLKASIAYIKSVKLNGISISNANFTEGHSALYFTTPQTGYIEVEYVGYYQVGFPDYTVTPKGNLAVVEMYYLNQVLKHYWYTTDADFGTEGARVFIDDNAYVYRGFKAYMLDEGIPRAKLYSNGEEFYLTNDSADSTYISTSSITLEPATYPEYTYTIPAAQVVEFITSFGNEITPVETIVDETKVLTFSQYYPKVELTVSEPCKVVTLPATEIEGEILLTMENTNTHRTSEFDIGNIDANDIATLPCKLNQDIPINVVEITGMSIQDIVGRTVICYRPNDGSSTHQIQPDGYIKVFVDMNGEYRVDVANVMDRTEAWIVLTVSV